jgi:hypothetical protein
LAQPLFHRRLTGTFTFNYTRSGEFAEEKSSLVASSTTSFQNRIESSVGIIQIFPFFIFGINGKHFEIRLIHLENIFMGFEFLGSDQEMNVV